MFSGGWFLRRQLRSMDWTSWDRCRASWLTRKGLSSWRRRAISGILRVEGEEKTLVVDDRRNQGPLLPLHRGMGHQTRSLERDGGSSSTDKSRVSHSLLGGDCDRCEVLYLPIVPSTFESPTENGPRKISAAIVTIAEELIDPFSTPC